MMCNFIGIRPKSYLTCDHHDYKTMEDMGSFVPQSKVGLGL